MTDIKWTEPPTPAAKTRSGKWRDIRAALEARPGEWALVGENISASMGTSLRRAGFELRTHKKPEYDRGRVDLYMRYVGEVSA